MLGKSKGGFEIHWKIRKVQTSPLKIKKETFKCDHFSRSLFEFMWNFNINLPML